jgi:hypothetical protein
MKEPLAVTLGKKVAEEMRNVEDPFYSDIHERTKRLMPRARVEQRHLLYNTVCDELKKQGKRIWS